MSTLLHLYSGHDGPFKINADENPDDPCIWIRTNRDTVSLTMDAATRQDLRRALDEIDARERRDRIAA